VRDSKFPRFQPCVFPCCFSGRAAEPISIYDLNTLQIRVTRRWHVFSGLLKRTLGPEAGREARIVADRWVFSERSENTPKGVSDVRKKLAPAAGKKHSTGMGSPRGDGGGRVVVERSGWVVVVEMKKPSLAFGPPRFC